MGVLSLGDLVAPAPMPIAYPSPYTPPPSAAPSGMDLSAILALLKPPQDDSLEKQIARDRAEDEKRKADQLRAQAAATAQQNQQLQMLLTPPPPPPAPPAPPPPPKTPWGTIALAAAAAWVARSWWKRGGR